MKTILILICLCVASCTSVRRIARAGVKDLARIEANAIVRPEIERYVGEKAPLVLSWIAGLLALLYGYDKSGKLKILRKENGKG